MWEVRRACASEKSQIRSGAEEMDAQPLPPLSSLSSSLQVFMETCHTIWSSAYYHPPGSNSGNGNFSRAADGFPELAWAGERVCEAPKRGRPAAKNLCLGAPRAPPSDRKASASRTCGFSVEPGRPSAAALKSFSSRPWGLPSNYAGAKGRGAVTHRGPTR